MTCTTAKAAPMLKNETMLLVQLVALNKVINNKSTNASNNRLKDEAWQNLTNNFNSSISSFPRTTAQLRLKWENLKKTARKRYANMRSKLSQTRSGLDYFPPDEVLDKVAAVLGDTCQSFSMEVGGDTSNKKNLNSNSMTDEGNIEGDVLNVSNVNKDEDSDGDNCEGEVISEIEFIETPPPKQKNFSSKLNFCSANRSGTLAKRKHKMEEDKCKARIHRENALAEYLIAKKRKLDLENEEKEMSIAKLKLELEKAKLENLKLKTDLNVIG